MTLPIGIVGAGGDSGTQFIVPQIVVYSGGAVHPPTVAAEGEQDIFAGLTAYAGATIHAPTVTSGGVLAAGLTAYSGVTIHPPELAGQIDLAAGLTVYGGAAIHAPSLAGAQDVNAGLTAYAGATIHAPTVDGSLNLLAGLTAYSGAGIHAPTVESAATPDVAILDAMADTGATTAGAAGSFSVSSGSNRTLVYLMCYAGSSDTISACSWGGQAMTQRVLANGSGGFPSHVRLWTLGESGIAAASGTGFSVTGNPNGRYRALAGSFENVDQTSPIVDTGTLAGDLSSGEITLTSEAGGFAVAAAAATTNLTYTWGGITERVGTENDSTLSYTGASGATSGTSIVVDPDTSVASGQQSAAAISLRKA